MLIAFAELTDAPDSVPKSCIPLAVHNTAWMQEDPHVEFPTIWPESLMPLAVAPVLLPLSNVPKSFMPVDLDQVKACQFPPVVFEYPTTWPRLLMAKAVL